MIKRKKRILTKGFNRPREFREKPAAQSKETFPAVVIEAAVLLDMESAWLHCARQRLGREIVQVNHSWSFPSRYGLNNDEAHGVFNHFEQEGYWGKIEPYPDSRGVLYALEKLGVAVWVLVNADPSHEAEINLSLGGMVKPRRVITMGQHATAMDRMQALNRLSARAYLDIETDTLNAVVSRIPILAYLHRGYTDMAVPDASVTVIDDILDYPEMLKNWLSSKGKRVA